MSEKYDWSLVVTGVERVVKRINELEVENEALKIDLQNSTEEDVHIANLRVKMCGELRDKIKILEAEAKATQE